MFINTRCDHNVIDHNQDIDGRFIMINIEIGEFTYTIINLYVPNEDKTRNTFFKHLTNKISDLNKGFILVAGDFN